jgi:YfiH family protein
MSIEFLPLNWQLPSNIKAVVTTRKGGVSEGNYASLNIASHVDDNPENVLKNRELLRQHLPSEPLWLKQNHTTNILNLVSEAKALSTINHIEYDGAVSTNSNQVLAVMTADCVPILITDVSGSFVAAIHAGWKGIAEDIISATMANLPQVVPSTVLVYIAPSICYNHFEVDWNVYQQMIELKSANYRFFRFNINSGKFNCDLISILQSQLIRHGVLASNITLSNYCTYCEERLFYSYRRDKETGRIVSCIWRN